MKKTFINDKIQLNTLYRGHLCQSYQEKGFHIENLNLTLYDVQKWFNYFVCSKNEDGVISSNLRSNLLTLILLRRRRKTIIINGLGRYKKSKIFRNILAVLISIQSKDTRTIFQNYADFRLYRRHASSELTHRLFWIPGSGGQTFGVASSKEKDRIAWVTRNSKFKLQCSSVSWIASIMNYQRINVYGTSLKSIVRLPSGCNLAFHGFVAKKKQLYSEFDVLVCPAGYGEGVPHTLVEALVNAKTVVLPKREAISYGLHLLCEWQPIKNSELVRIESNECLREKLSVEVITEEYFRIIEGLNV